MLNAKVHKFHDIRMFFHENKRFHGKKLILNCYFVP
jgi:hypothetical protein